jgi:hypothetical protein
MTFDPTTNRVPFYLLTELEKRAMKAWPHGWEYFSSVGWEKISDPAWFQTTVYRGKPAPVVTSQWFNVYQQGPTPTPYPARKMADEAASFNTRIGVLRIDTCDGVSTPHLEDI